MSTRIPAELVTQPGPAPTRKVAAAAIAGTVGGPLVSYAALSWLGADLSPDCAEQVSVLLISGITAVGGVLAGAAGYLIRERA